MPFVSIFKFLLAHACEQWILIISTFPAFESRLPIINPTPYCARLSSAIFCSMAKQNLIGMIVAKKKPPIERFCRNIMNMLTSVFIHECSLARSHETRAEERFSPAGGDRKGVGDEKMELEWWDAQRKELMNWWKRRCTLLQQNKFGNDTYFSNAHNCLFLRRDRKD